MMNLSKLPLKRLAFACTFVCIINTYFLFGKQSNVSSLHHKVSLKELGLQKDIAISIHDVAVTNISTTNISGYIQVWPKVKKVVLFTSYRGGSTFLGEIFGQNPQVFYWFEPLNQYMDYYKSVEEATGHSVVERVYMKTESGLESLPLEALYNRSDVILETLSCSPRNRVIQRGSSAAISNHMPAAVPYSSCLKHGTNSVDYCKPLLTDACHKSRIVVVKSMRLPIYLVEDLLKADASTKVIYYVRDPRGLINSRKKLGDFKKNNMIENAADYCQKMVKNEEYLAIFKEKYPNNIMSVRYEDLSKQADKVTEAIYKFLDEPVPDEVKSWIHENTLAKRSNGRYDTKRNSIEVMSKWKRELSSLDINAITDKCLTAIQILGYADQIQTS